MPAKRKRKLRRSASPPPELRFQTADCPGLCRICGLPTCVDPPACIGTFRSRIKRQRYAAKQRARSACTICGKRVRPITEWYGHPVVPTKCKQHRDADAKRHRVKASQKALARLGSAVEREELVALRKERLDLIAVCRGEMELVYDPKTHRHELRPIEPPLQQA